MAALKPGTYEYLDKVIVQLTGFEPKCWRCKEVHFTMGQNIKCLLTFEGWKDEKAFVAGKAPTAENVSVILENCEKMLSYPSVFQELMGRTISDPQFKSADYKTITVK